MTSKDHAPASPTTQKGWRRNYCPPGCSWGSWREMQAGPPSLGHQRLLCPRSRPCPTPILTVLQDKKPSTGSGSPFQDKGAGAPLSHPDGLADGPRLGLDPAPCLSGHQLPAVPLELDLPFLLQKCLFISLPIPASPCVPFLLTGSSPHPSPPVPPASLLHNFGSGSSFLRSRLPSPSELALNCHRPHLPSCWQSVTFS